MIVFQDTYQNEVHLSFEQQPFSKDPKHVWVVCRYGQEWLLTNHRERGLEFPGGKVEEGESPEQAAIREVMEETGGIIKSIQYIGQYKVLGKGKTIVKNIYFAKVEKLTDQTSYFETNGPVLLEELPLETIHYDRQYSFIMKDDVLKHSIEYVENLMKESSLDED